MIIDFTQKVKNHYCNRTFSPTQRNFHTKICDLLQSVINQLQAFCFARHYRQAYNNKEQYNKLYKRASNNSVIACVTNSEFVNALALFFKYTLGGFCRNGISYAFSRTIMTSLRPVYMVPFSGKSMMCVMILKQKQVVLFVIYLKSHNSTTRDTMRVISVI